MNTISIITAQRLAARPDVRDTLTDAEIGILDAYTRSPRYDRTSARDCLAQLAVFGEMDTRTLAGDIATAFAAADCDGDALKRAVAAYELISGSTI